MGGPGTTVYDRWLGFQLREPITKNLAPPDCSHIVSSMEGVFFFFSHHTRPLETDLSRVARVTRRSFYPTLDAHTLWILPACCTDLDNKIFNMNILHTINYIGRSTILEFFFPIFSSMITTHEWKSQLI